MKKLQNLVASRQWDEALQLVMKTGDEREQLQMKSTLAAREAALLLLQRKFIDFLLLKQLPEALRTFQEEILPLCEPSEAEVKQLAELLLCRDADEMKQRTSRPWQDDELQLKLEELVSPEEIIPEGALRNANENSIAYQWSGRRVLDVVVHPHDSKVFVLISGYEIRVYDVAHKSDELFIEADNVMSCLTISPSGKFLLVNFVKQEQLTCIEIATGSVVAKYHGIREQRYVLRPCFIGAHSELVASGSEGTKILLIK
ncbi:WD repeat-containing protein 26 [Phytophthora nicotianae]|uniref:WD repeat-containing protein 26 n=1 Tax=Phytophthora nicotianae TaxID=4792 RepID=A0A0W8CYZ8_PHYNI|nr:WD repeat-containing protein 26 [Phytophthora nicotianae]